MCLVPATIVSITVEWRVPRINICVFVDAPATVDTWTNDRIWIELRFNPMTNRRREITLKYLKRQRLGLLKAYKLFAGITVSNFQR